MPNQRSQLAPQYQYNARALRYTEAATGRFVKRVHVFEAAEKQITTSKRRMEVITNNLRHEKISLNEWRSEMVNHIRTAHTAQYALGQGGWANMKTQDYTRIEQTIKKQIKYLNGFVKDLQNDFKGATDIDGRATIRAQMYAQASQPTYHQSTRIAAHKIGKQKERRILNPAEHCQDCIDEADRGWQPINTLAPIGSLTCNVGCKCDLVFSDD